MQSYLPLPTNKKFIDLTGRIFARLTALGIKEKRGTKYFWECRCSCGQLTLVESYTLLHKTRSCGCLQREFAISKATHGHNRVGHRSKEYTAYAQAKKRCNNPNDHGYKNYGNRGIKFLFTSFQEFIDHIGPKPSHLHSLDRKDNEGHYVVGNVRWATRDQQRRNCRSLRLIIKDGQTLCAKDWSRLVGISSVTGYARLSRGWCEVCSFTKPPRSGRCPHKA